MMGQRLTRGNGKRSRFLQSAISMSAALSFSTLVVSKQQQIAFVTRDLSRCHRHIRNMATIKSEKEVAVPSPSPWQDVLPYEQSSHRSVKILIPAFKMEGDPFDKSTFKTKLENTIASCRELDVSSIWVQVPMSRGALLEDMTESGLQFHHAEGDTANLLLWLGKGESKVPTFATHQIGVGAMVVNSRDEILCVREIRNNFMPWKIPGGLSELGEQLDEAVIREVMEETGVPCRFKSIVCFRHTHELQFGRSDLYFVCALEPIEKVNESGKNSIPTPIPQEGEIECVAWVPMQDYRDLVFGENGHPMMKHVIRIFDQGKDIRKTIVNSIVPGRKANPIYHPPFNSCDEGF